MSAKQAMYRPAAASRPSAGGGLRFYGVVAALCVVGVLLLAFWGRGGGSAAAPAQPFKASMTPFDGERAYDILKQICAIGPRVSGSEGMARQQDLLKDHFEKLGGKVSLQEFEGRRPIDGARVKMANLIVEWHPERKERILLCAHYDTRPYPDEDPDPRRRRDPFIGANDGASGVALLCEMGRHMPDLKSRYGVDFVLFDAEELIYDPSRDPYFLGSEHFARQYVAQPPEHRYRWGVLVDMIGDKELQIFREANSMAWPDTRPLVLDIWATARSMGVREFIHVTKYDIRDDHLALRNIAKIPTCDIIDFDYPRPRGPNYWHTTKDVPENCSAESLTKVGAVLLTWLQRAK